LTNMRTAILAAIVCLAAGVAQARNINCPVKADAAKFFEHGGQWQLEYFGPLKRVELLGNANSEAIIGCVKEIGAATTKAQRCRMVPGRGKLTSSDDTPNSRHLICSLEGLDPSTNDTDCLVVCD
jgi:hypothetical protein